MLLMGLMIVAMLFEMLGIGLIVPALALMTHTEMSNSLMVASWAQAIGHLGHQQQVVWGMIILVLVYMLKSIFLGYLAWYQARFIHDVQAKLSQRMFAGYLHQPYTFHLQRNSSQLIRNVISQVSEFISALQYSLLLITEILVLLGVSVLLLIVEPLGAILVAGVLGIAGWGFYRATKDRILRWGESRQFHEGLRIQHLQQGLGGAKETKLLGREKAFLDSYGYHNIGSARIGERQAFLQALPRLWLELLAVVGLAVLVLIMMMQGKPVENIVPTMGLFAAAAFRFMPSVNRVLAAIQNVRFLLPAINSLSSELSLFDVAFQVQQLPAMSYKNELNLENVSFQYTNRVAHALSRINVSIPRGASIGFIGESGAGKSTLVDVMLGLLKPVSGYVKADSRDIQENLRSWQDQIGYVPQSIYLTDDTLRRNIAFGIADAAIDEGALWRAVRAAQLDDFVSGLPQGLDTFVGERGVRLSGGQRQRIGIARALYHNPAILVLDEATSALDTQIEQEVMKSLIDLKGEKTLIIVAHRTSTLEHCDYIYKLDDGHVVAEGAAKELLKHAKQH